MAARLTPEVKAAKTLLSLLDSFSFDSGAFVVYLSMAPLIIKQRLLQILLEFVDYHAEVWHERNDSVPMGSEDFYRDAARMADAFAPYRT